MTEMIKSEEISRRKALSFLGLVAAFNLAASSTVLTASEAEAQTAGMERRQERQAEGMRAPGFGRNRRIISTAGLTRSKARYRPAFSGYGLHLFRTKCNSGHSHCKT